MNVPPANAFRAFDELTDTYTKAKAVLEGSCIHSDTTSRDDLLREWTAARRFIAAAIDRSGTLLDFGCANGYLLRCLLEWSPHALIPYGVDIDHRRLAEARAMFPGISTHFTNQTALELHRSRPEGFDLVYWAVGDNIDFTTPENRRWFRNVARLTAAGGRLILGFYGEASANASKIRDLERDGIELHGTLANGDRSEVACWLDT